HGQVGSAVAVEVRHCHRAGLRPGRVGRRGHEAGQVAALQQFEEQRPPPGVLPRGRTASETRPPQARHGTTPYGEGRSVYPAKPPPTLGANPCPDRYECGLTLNPARSRVKENRRELSPVTAHRSTRRGGV